MAPSRSTQSNYERREPAAASSHFSYRKGSYQFKLVTANNSVDNVILHRPELVAGNDHLPVSSGYCEVYIKLGRGAIF